MPLNPSAIRGLGVRGQASAKVGARVTEKVLADVAENGDTRAVISLHGVAQVKNSLVTVVVGNDRYVIRKGLDTHSAAIRDQNPDTLEDFCGLYNLLEENPGQLVGEVHEGAVTPAAPALEEDDA